MCVNRKDFFCVSVTRKDFFVCECKGPLEIQAEKVLFFRCKSDFFREKTTFFSKHVGKKVLKKSAFVKCGTFCWNVEFVDFCSISWILPKKAKMTEIGIFGALILGGASP